VNSKRLQSQADEIPFFKFLNLEVVNTTDKATTCIMPATERLIGNSYLGNIHGGIIASCMEATASLAVFDRPRKGAPKPINLTVNYLRPAKMNPLHCRAKVIRAGRRIAFVETIAWQVDEDTPVAKGQFQFLLI